MATTNPLTPAPLVAPYTPATGAAAQATATDWNVTPESTVSGQMTGLLAADSPYMQEAVTRSKQQANASGLLNSSMAAGAGTSAAINSALPIAQQDASTFSQAGQWNAGNKTQNSQFNAGNSQQMNLANMDSTNQAAQFNNSQYMQQLMQGEQFQQQVKMYGLEAAQQNLMQSNEFAQAKEMFTLDEGLKKWLVNTDYANTTALANLDLANKKALANVEANYKTLMQTSESAASMYTDVVGKILAISADPNMDAASKTATINAAQAYLNNGLNVLGSINGVDIGSLLTFG